MDVSSKLREPGSRIAEEHNGASQKSKYALYSPRSPGPRSGSPRPAVLLWLALTLFWMAFMYKKSAEPYTQQDMRPWLSSSISQQQLTAWLPKVSFTYGGQRITYQEPYDMAEFFVRKAGHATEYAILAWLWTRTLRRAAGIRGHSRSQARAVIAAAAIALLYAASDEWHQSFVPGRTGHAIDVVVDTGGIALAGAAELAIARIYRKQKKK